MQALQAQQEHERAKMAHEHQEVLNSLSVAQGDSAEDLEAQQQIQALLIQQKASQQGLLTEQQAALWKRSSDHEAAEAALRQQHETQLADAAVPDGSDSMDDV